MLRITWTAEQTRTLPEGGDRLEQESGELLLDILTSEALDSTAAATKHAVEEGAPVNDYVILEQDTMQFDAVISRRPANTRLVPGSQRGTTTLADDTEVAGIVLPDGVDRPVDVLDQLITLKNNKQLVDVDGLQRTIEGWVILGVSAPRSVDTAGTLTVSVSMQDFKTVSLEEIDTPSPRVERGRSSSDQGNANQSNEDGEDDSANGENLQSAARATLNLLRGRDSSGGGS